MILHCFVLSYANHQLTEPTLYIRLSRGTGSNSSAAADEAAETERRTPTCGDGAAVRHGGRGGGVWGGNNGGLVDSQKAQLDLGGLAHRSQVFDVGHLVGLFGSVEQK